MELNISEFDDELYSTENNSVYYENEEIQSSFEKIPENTVPIKVIKKGVHFDDNVFDSNKRINQPIPKVNARVVRQQMPPPKQKISYEEILSKMGMLVSDGKLHLVDRNSVPGKMEQQKQAEFINNQRPQSNNNIHTVEQNIPPNSYIYNKYFKDNLQTENTIRRPKNLQEYKMMLLQDYIQRQRIKQMKSTKLIMPTSNINISGGNSANLNKLFSFSKR